MFYSHVGAVRGLSGKSLLKFEVTENKFWRLYFMIIRIVWGVKRLFIVG